MASSATSAGSAGTPSSTTGATHWWHPDYLRDDTATSESASSNNIDALCIGTGRFLRAVLIPILTRNGTCNSTVCVQPRGRSFFDAMVRQGGGSYEIDTVLRDGSLESSCIPVAGAFSWGDEELSTAFYQQCLPKLVNIRILGVGVTEAGLSSADTPIMQALYQFLSKFKQLQQEYYASSHDNQGPPKLCVINMDNVPNNGNTLRSHMRTLSGSDDAMALFLESHVVFLNTMVDRITSQREGSNGLVPRAEPVPQKALVVLDPHQDLPDWFRQMADIKDEDDSLGLILRSQAQELQADLALKLRIANGTHTALAHVMALLQATMTDLLAQDDTNPFAATLLGYVDALIMDQILPATRSLARPADARAAWQDWRNRLTHAHFGLSTYFITQNGPAKGGIRLGPTIVDLLNHKPDSDAITVTMAFALAVLLRWLTPHKNLTNNNGNPNVYRGWLPHTNADGATVSYADGLSYNFHEGWYEFKCACSVWDPEIHQNRNLADWLAALRQSGGGIHQPCTYVSVVRAYLVSPEGGNQAEVAHAPAFEELCQAIATLYARMVAGDDLYGMLEEMQDKKGPYTQGWSTSCRCLVDDVASSRNGEFARTTPLHYRSSPVPSISRLMTHVTVAVSEMAAVVASEVAGVQAIDLHTHLLPPTHGPLCLWGIDEMLTYHYLVSEYFMTAPAEMTPEIFFAKTKQQQANMIWQALFVDRSPLSEACRGVVTTLLALGLRDEVRTRNLTAIRAVYASFRDRGANGAAAFSDLVFEKAGVKYNIMTNIPFDSNEAQYWRPKPASYSSHYRSALRVDPLLAGDRTSIENALKASGYDLTLEGARQYLRDWCDTMKPEYMMASTPHDFVLSEGILSNAPTSGSINTEAMKEPGAFAMASGGETCSPSSDDAPSLINEQSDFLSQVLMKVCEERDLPLALKIGAHRGVNPKLKSAGDGMVAFADTSVLARLCSKYPKVRFLGKNPRDSVT